MNHELISINQQVIGETKVQTVDARELHAFLKSKKKFADWISRRIRVYGFQENQDFISFSPFGEKPSGGRPTIEYALTVNMAKELCMVERTERGRQARRYFIECEQRLLNRIFEDSIDTHGMSEAYKRAIAAHFMQMSKNDSIPRYLRTKFQFLGAEVLTGKYFLHYMQECFPAQMEFDYSGLTVQ